VKKTLKKTSAQRAKKKGSDQLASRTRCRKREGDWNLVERREFQFLRAILREKIQTGEQGFSKKKSKKEK